MDGETDGASPSEQNTNAGFLMEAKNLEEVKEESSINRLHKELNGSPYLQTQYSGNSGSDSELDWTESSCSVPPHPVCVSEEGWLIKGEEERCPSPTLEYWVCLDNQSYMADGHLNKAVSPPVPPGSGRLSLPVSCSGPVTAGPEVCSSTTDSHSVSSAAWDSLRSTSRSPISSDQYPISAAAHLHLLGESLSLIGHHLQKTNKKVCLSSSLSLLLDSLLCALAPLMSLTTQMPELISCTEHTLASTLENIAYVMPGL